MSKMTWRLLAWVTRRMELPSLEVRRTEREAGMGREDEEFSIGHGKFEISISCSGCQVDRCILQISFYLSLYHQITYY